MIADWRLGRTGRDLLQERCARRQQHARV